jgi:hypothetical protein
LFHERAQHVHLLVQVASPHFAYALTRQSLRPILAAAQSGVLLQLSTVGETHARFVAVQPRPSSDAAEGSSSPEARTAEPAAETCARLKVVLTVSAEEVDVVAGVGAAEASMLSHVLLVLLLDLRLLVDGLLEVCEGIGEVVAGESSPVRRHGGWLSLESSGASRSRRDRGHAEQEKRPRGVVEMLGWIGRY